MTTPRTTEQLLQAFLVDGVTELPDRAYEAVRREIHGARRHVFPGPWRISDPRVGAPFAAAAVAVIAIAIVLFDLRPGTGPGSPRPSPTGTATATAGRSADATPALPGTFTSPLYGYTITIPPGWITAAAIIPWDGTRQSGPDAESDKFAGPGQVMSWAFAGPYTGSLAEFVQNRIAANHRDHADTCPKTRPDINEPTRIGDQAGVLLGWNCGAVINMAVTVRAGVAYSFVFRDLGINAASDPADTAVFGSILDSVIFPR